MCECLNVTVAFSVLFLTNKFLNHRFLLYGLKVWRYYSLPEEEHRFEINPMCDTFPRIATCDYYRWGPGGRQENVNAICVLALNMINDKVFLIFWFWLLILLITGCSRIFFRLFQVRSAVVRFQMINLRMNRYFRRSSTKLMKIEAYLKQCKIGDWFVLYQLSKNLNRPFFMEFLTKLSVEYDKDCEEEERILLSGGSVLIEAKYRNNKLLGQMHRVIHTPKHNGQAPLCQEEDTGDSFLEMILQPALDEVDGKGEGDKNKDEK